MPKRKDQRMNAISMADVIRKTLQEVLAPELQPIRDDIQGFKADILEIKTEIKILHSEIKRLDSRIDNFEKSVSSRMDHMEKSLTTRMDSLEKQMQFGREDFKVALDLHERLAALEAKIASRLN